MATPGMRNPQDSPSSVDDPYAGFENADFDHAYDLENVYNDREFIEAAVRSSHGRRPGTAGRLMTAGAGGPQQPNSQQSAAFFRNGVQSSLGGRAVSTAAAGTRHQTAALRSVMGSRMARTGAVTAETANRPMTAVRGAGYTSAGRTSNLIGSAASRSGTALSSASGTDKKNESLLEKVRKQEVDVGALLTDSILAFDVKDYKKSLDKAKEAGRRERASVKFRTTHTLGDANLDLTLTVLTNLAQQYLANNMTNEALHVYQTIVKNKSFANSGRLRVNIGNIYFRKRDFPKAVKYYRMAMDQVPKVQQRARTNILNNIGVTLIKLGKYEEALGAFEDCLDAYGDYETALNLVLAAYCLEDGDKMRESFQRMVDIPLLIDEEPKDAGAENDILAMQLMSNDPLSAWERRRKQQAERTILIAAKIIAPSIAGTFSEGYAWCIETIKQSSYAPLATELDMNKAVDLFKQGELDAAMEALHTFSNKESKIASAASNNLSLISIMRGQASLDEATQYCEQALNLDRYNSNAFVNRGNIYYLNGELKLAQQCYKEALQIEASCVQALFNLGAIAKELGELEEAKQHLFKLNDILVNNVQVLVQLASIYEQQEDFAQAIELYSQANNLSPTDPAILQRLAALYDAEGDKPQAFQCNYDSYRFFPPNIDVIKWLGNYYLYAQFPEKAVNYFAKAALMEPHNIEWQLLMASCQRRSGNFQKAMGLYRQVHRKFPNNAECLKFLVQLCRDLHLPEEREYAEKLGKLEKINQLRVQRENESGASSRRPTSTSALPSTPTMDFLPPPVSRRGLRNASATSILSDPNTSHYQARKKEINPADLVFKDPVGPAPIRPMTGVTSQNVGNIFDNDNVLDDNLLPD